VTSHAYAVDYVDIALKSCAYLEEDMPKHTECVSNFLKQTCESIRETGNLSEAQKCYEDAKIFLVVRVQELQALAQYHEYETKKIEEERRLLREDTNRRIEALRAKIK
jgi:hypothetical protein